MHSFYERWKDLKPFSFKFTGMKKEQYFIRLAKCVLNSDQCHWLAPKGTCMTRCMFKKTLAFYWQNKILSGICFLGSD